MIYACLTIFSSYVSRTIFYKFSQLLIRIFELIFNGKVSYHLLICCGYHVCMNVCPRYISIALKVMPLTFSGVVSSWCNG